jgi:hypothetical protein
MVRSEGPARGREWAAATDRVPAVESETPAIYKTTQLIQKISIADPGSTDLMNPGSRMEKNLDPGWK